MKRINEYLNYLNECLNSIEINPSIIFNDSFLYNNINEDCITCYYIYTFFTIYTTFIFSCRICIIIICIFYNTAFKTYFRVRCSWKIMNDHERSCSLQFSIILYLIENIWINQLITNDYLWIMKVHELS